MIIGHKQIRQGLADLYKNGRLPGTLLFAGPTGIGKKLCALELAEILLGNSKINHPDLHLVDAGDKENFKVENLRDFLAKLTLMSFSGGNRVAIIDHADSLSIAAFNILLKTLEEPLPGLYFILITANPSRLPITILSRCQTKNFPELTEEQILEIAGCLGTMEPLGKKLAARYCGGSASLFLELYEKREEFSDVLSKLELILNRAEVSAIMDLVLYVGKERDSFLPKLNLLIIATRNLLLAEDDPQKIARLSRLATVLPLFPYYVFDRIINLGYLLEESLFDLAGVGNDTRLLTDKIV